MKYLAAYLLLNLAGKESPSASDIKELLSELEGKNIQELIAEGTTKLASVPSGGAGGAAPAAAAAAGGAAPAAEEKKEEAKEEEESDEDMGFGLFD
ncbi:60s acidic ribosomal protein-domain-containing protein [Penicillium chermesinum]|nr:60s acidic ribosomal protein-domain-containing protein [Penicillium chermesinum]